MSGMLDKAKDALKGNSGGSSGGSGSGQPSGIEKAVNKQAHTGIDAATDRVGMGDKYDDKINKLADGQINKQIPGGQQ